MKIVLEGTEAEVLSMLAAISHSFLGTPEESRSKEEEPNPPPPMGRLSFLTLAQNWADGFDATGTGHWEDGDQDRPEVNRGALLQEAMNGKEGAWILQHVRDCGGLTQAVHSALGGDADLSRAISANISQVASILCPPLAQTHEPLNPLE